MHPNTELNEYIKQLHHYIEHQSKKMKRLEEAIKQVEKEIIALKEKPTTINYKFDQLKVEKLSGTLNIGLTPKSSGEIEELTVEGKIEDDVAFPVENQHTELLLQTKNEIEQYLETDAINRINEVEKKYHHSLDENYKQLIISDIKRQIDERIQLYINKMNHEMKTKPVKQLKQSIINKMKTDIQTAIDAFISHLPKRED